MTMDITTKTINFTNRVSNNNINNTAREVLKQTPEATTTTKAIHNSQAFQALSFKDQMITPHLFQILNIDHN